MEFLLVTAKYVSSRLDSFLNACLLFLKKRKKRQSNENFGHFKLINFHSISNSVYKLVFYIVYVLLEIFYCLHEYNLLFCAAFLTFSNNFIALQYCQNRMN